MRSQIDLALVLARDVGPSFKALPLFNDELVAIMPVNYDLTERPWVEAADFADQALVTDEPWGDGGVHAVAMLVPASVRPARLVAVGSSLVVVDMVGAGFGLGIVSRRMADAQAKSGGVRMAPIGKRGFQTSWQVVVRSEEAAVSSATFISERMSYWCEGSVASTLSLISP